MVTKVVGGIVGLGLISTGGIAMAKPHWLGIDYMPTPKFLSQEDNFSSTYTNPKFGHKYGKYLVGSKKENKSWWEWAYRRLSREEVKTGKFTNKGNSDSKKVSSDFAEDSEQDNSKALNQICKVAYGTEDQNDNFDENNTDGSKFKKSDVWKYCSPGLLTNTSKDNPTYSEEKIGGATDNKSKLVSVKDSANDWFWEIRNKDFWEASGDWSGTKATTDNDKSIFKKEYEDNKSNEKARKTIKKLCEAAYNTTKKASGTDNNNEDALKFCVLEATGS